jgi:hypothetical protein
MIKLERRAGEATRSDTKRGETGLSGRRPRRSPFATAEFGLIGLVHANPPPLFLTPSAGARPCTPGSS